MRRQSTRTVIVYDCAVLPCLCVTDTYHSPFSYIWNSPMEDARLWLFFTPTMPTHRYPSGAFAVPLKNDPLLSPTFAVIELSTTT